MNIHTTSLALIETDALTPADKSARVVSVALESCSVERMRSSWADVHSESGKARAEAEQAVKTATAEIVASELGIRQLASELGRALWEGK